MYLAKTFPSTDTEMGIAETGFSCSLIKPAPFNGLRSSTKHLGKSKIRKKIPQFALTVGKNAGLKWLEPASQSHMFV